MANRDDYKFIFTQKNTTKPIIEIGEKTFKVNNRSMIMRIVNEAFRDYLRISKKIKTIADQINDTKDEREMLNLSEQVIDEQTKMSDIADKIIVLLIGEDGNRYVDEELEISFEDKQELATTLYSLASGQNLQKEESEESESFRNE